MIDGVKKRVKTVILTLGQLQSRVEAPHSIVKLYVRPVGRQKVLTSFANDRGNHFGVLLPVPPQNSESLEKHLVILQVLKKGDPIFLEKISNSKNLRNLIFF